MNRGCTTLNTQNKAYQWITYTNSNKCQSRKNLGIWNQNCFTFSLKLQEISMSTDAYLNKPLSVGFRPTTKVYRMPINITTQLSNFRKMIQLFWIEFNKRVKKRKVLRSWVISSPYLQANANKLYNNSLQIKLPFLGLLQKKNKIPMENIAIVNKNNHQA